VSDVIGLVPAAGKGVRLGLPYPKELYPIIRNNRYKPVSQFVIENLTASGVDHVVFVINETKHQLIGYYGDGTRFGCRFSYVVQEQRESDARSTSPGLGHALNAAYHLTAGKTVCFGMADTIMSPFDIYRHLLDALGPGDAAVLGVFPAVRPEISGMVDFEAGGCVRAIVDKPASTHLTHGWGLIVWRPVFTDYLRGCIEDRDIVDFADVMNHAIADGLTLRACAVPGGAYTDLGTYEEIEELERRHRA
jgi:glucose-1-phosphate thymidylyltransferase